MQCLQHCCVPLLFRHLSLVYAAAAAVDDGDHHDDVIGCVPRVDNTQVARRVRSADYIARLAQEGRLQRHATRYMPACLSEEVFLHPRRCVWGSVCVGGVA